jgi:uncharacterized membrane protein YbaN (DUF454 family)
MWLSIRHALGMILIMIGLIGMPLPIVPGLPIVLGGAALLGRRHPWVIMIHRGLRRFNNSARRFMCKWKSRRG